MGKQVSTEAPFFRNREELEAGKRVHGWLSPDGAVGGQRCIGRWSSRFFGTPTLRLLLCKPCARTVKGDGLSLWV